MVKRLDKAQREAVRELILARDMVSLAQDPALDLKKSLNIKVMKQHIEGVREKLGLNDELFENSEQLDKEGLLKCQ